MPPSVVAAAGVSAAKPAAGIAGSASNTVRAQIHNLTFMPIPFMRAPGGPSHRGS